MEQFAVGTKSCLTTISTCDKCDEEFTEETAHTCDTRPFFAEIVNSKACTMRRGGIRISEFELRIARDGERVKGKCHHGRLLARVTSGNGYPQWMVNARDAINDARPTNELQARLIASIEKEK